MLHAHSALALARTLDVDVDRPVGVVLAADFEHEPDPQSRLAPPPRTVVHPRHDASHHLAAASDFANGIGERLAALAQRLDTLQGHTRELDALRDDLVTWSRRFPRGRLDDLRRRIDARSRELDMAPEYLAPHRAWAYCRPAVVNDAVVPASACGLPLRRWRATLALMNNGRILVMTK